MGKPEFEQLPKDLLAAASRAGVGAPLWYAGPIMDREVVLEGTLDEVVVAARGHRIRGVVLGDPMPNTPLLDDHE